jgi:hypothetical protein
MLTVINFSGLVKSVDNKIYKGALLDPNSLVKEFTNHVSVHRVPVLIPVDFDTTIGEAFKNFLLILNSEDFKQGLIAKFSKMFIYSYSQSLAIIKTLQDDALDNFKSMDEEKLSQTVVDYCKYESKNFTDLTIVIDIIWLIKKTVNVKYTATMVNFDE